MRLFGRAEGDEPLFQDTQIGKPLNNFASDGPCTQIEKSALTRSPRCWNPLKGLYLRNAPAAFPEGRFGLYGLSGASNGSKCRRGGTSGSRGISAEHTTEEIKKKKKDTLGGDAPLLSEELGVLDNTSVLTQVQST